MAGILYRSMLDPMLPWDTDPEEMSRFKKLVISFLVATIILGLIIPFITVEKPDRNKRQTIPPRLMKMVLEQKKIVKPPPPPPEPKEEEKPKEEEPKKEEKKPEEKKPEPVKTAKEVAKKHIAVFDALADLRDLDDMPDLKNNKSLSNDTGKAATVTRSLITKKATQGSGGIRVATASRSSGTGALRGQNETKVTSDIGDAVANTKRKLKDGSLKRSSENIQLAFEQAKPSIFSIYNRALRKNPELQGKVVFKLTIEPSGKVSSCVVVSSELNDPKLEKRIISRIKRIKFGAKNVARWTGSYPINFLPSS